MPKVIMCFFVIGYFVFLTDTHALDSADPSECFRAEFREGCSQDIGTQGGGGGTGSPNFNVPEDITTRKKRDPNDPFDCKGDPDNCLPTKKESFDIESPPDETKNIPTKTKREMIQERRRMIMCNKIKTPEDKQECLESLD
ncbi:MAG: hypothetical protein IT525_06970 [Nitrosomonas sp.]|jgi:hypothetical protein|nr:hypothetical protein [Nitrosomonas sp.]